MKRLFALLKRRQPAMQPPPVSHHRDTWLDDNRDAIKAMLAVPHYKCPRVRTPEEAAEADYPTQFVGE